MSEDFLFIRYMRYSYGELDAGVDNGFVPVLTERVAVAVVVRLIGAHFSSVTVRGADG